jgi:hypothetical protein
MGRWRFALAVALFVLAPALAAAQAPDGEEGPPHAFGVSLGGEFTGTFGSPDDGFFNFTDYEHSVTRLATASLAGALRFTPRLEILGELRLQNRDASASGLYVRVRPRAASRFAIQAGRIPPVFGRFSRRGYGGDNPLVGIPLAYQYLTTLRATEVPVGADALLDVRGRGWLVAYPSYINAGGIYGSHADAGLPLATATRWDTGVQAQFERTGLRAGIALTSGSLSNPRLGDDNDGKQLSGRVTWQPVPAIDLGLSLSRGAFLARGVTERLPAGMGTDDYVQTAWGADTEVSAGYWVIRGEVIVSAWRLPAIGTTPITEPLRSAAFTVESRYRLTPRLHVAARGEHLSFSELLGSAAHGEPIPWDAPVTRVETGVGYALHRHALLKLAWQYNWRDGVTRPQPREGFLAVQVSAWF